MKLEAVTAAKLAEGDVCAVAMDRHHGIALWRNLFTALIFAVAVVMAVTVGAAIVLALDENWVPAAIAAAGAAAEGKPLKWVLDRHGEAVKAEDEAFKQVREACGGTDDAEETRSAVSFF